MIDLVIPIAIQAVPVPVATPTFAPPPAPAPKRGTFACKVRDRADREFELSGAMRDWRKDGDRETAMIEITAPRKSGLSGAYRATIQFPQTNIVKLGPYGQVLGGGILIADFRPQGTIMLSQWARDGSKSEYVGFCDVRFTNDPEKSR